MKYADKTVNELLDLVHPGAMFYNEEFPELSISAQMAKSAGLSKEEYLQRIRLAIDSGAAGIPSLVLPHDADKEWDRAANHNSKDELVEQVRMAICSGLYKGAKTTAGVHGPYNNLPEIQESNPAEQYWQGNLLPSIHVSTVHPNPVPLLTEVESSVAIEFARDIFNPGDYVYFNLLNKKRGRHPDATDLPIPSDYGCFDAKASDLMEWLSKSDDFGDALGFFDWEDGAWICPNAFDGKGAGVPNVSTFRYAVIHCSTCRPGHLSALLDALGLQHTLVVRYHLLKKLIYLYAIAPIDAGSDGMLFSKRVRNLHAVLKNVGVVVDRHSRNANCVIPFPGAPMKYGGQYVVRKSAAGLRFSEWEERMAIEKLLPFKWITGSTTTQSVASLLYSPEPVEQNLLGNRWLCRGGIGLMIGASGSGKSTAGLQQDILWSCGRPAFGISTDKPLRVLHIQAENDDGDVKFACKGIIETFHLTEIELAAVDANLKLIRVNDKTGEDFLSHLDALLKVHKPDLVRMDPLHAYITGDMTRADTAAEFFRHGLSPLLKRYNCGLLLVHHPPKGVYRSGEKVENADLQYAGAGSAEITNLARCVLNIERCKGVRGVYRFIASKRSQQIGWVDEDGNPTDEKLFRQSGDPARIAWEDATPEDLIPESTDGLDFSKIMDLVRATPAKSMEKTRLLELCSSKLQIPDRRARELLKCLVEDSPQRLVEYKEAREGGGRDRVFIRLAQS